MSDQVLGSEILTILGGPSTVNLEVDFGPTGDRGTYIFNVLGNPNNSATELPDDFKSLDMCFNLQPGDDYLKFYQYGTWDGVQSWKELFKLQTNQYSKNYTGPSIKTFDSNGEIDIQVPVIDIVPLDSVANLTGANFNVQINIINTTAPVSISVTVGDISENALPITVRAVTFDGTDWSNLTGPYPVHLFITVV